LSKYFPNMPIGARGGLLDWKHVVQMDRSVFLFLWAVLRQTGRNKEGAGVVNYGKPLTLRQIADEMRAPYTTIKKWMTRQERNGYLSRRSFPDKSFALLVCNEKKFRAEKLCNANFPQSQDRPRMVGGSDHIWSEGGTKRGGVRASKRQKTFGFVPPNVKDLGTDWTKIRRPAAAALSPVNPETKTSEQTAPKTLREVAREKELPSVATQRQAEAAMRAQLASYRAYCQEKGIPI